MKIISVDRGYGRNKYTVQLEDDFEKELNSNELITYVDSGRATVERVRKTGDHPGHFGGLVNRRGDLVDVTVYID